MNALGRIFKQEHYTQPVFVWADVVVLVGAATLIYIGVRLATSAPAVISGPAISLAPGALPLYALFSTARMAAAYLLSLLFTLIYGYIAAYSRRAERFMMPLLDILQSVPILSFLPVVLLSFSAILPQGVAVELSSVVLIFTSQAWNMTFGWYQSLTTIPKELREASQVFRFNRWLRFKVLELPFGANSLIWNSMMSWAGGWFFLMAAEIFTVGQRDFRLPGLGAYLSEAASQGDARALAFGLIAVVLVIIALDQLLWRPLLAWGERFKLEMVEAEEPPRSWFLDVLLGSRLTSALAERVVRPASDWLDRGLIRLFPPAAEAEASRRRGAWLAWLPPIIIGAGLLYGAYRVATMLLRLPPADWAQIGVSILATLGRVLAALLIALAWTIPVGVAIGTNSRLRRWLQPVVQIAASVPATALFPILLLAVVRASGGLGLAAVVLMLMGTQWYVLFNVIAGASAIPQDLKYTASLLGLSRWERWRTLILPSIFPFVVTGAITASGGAWNASIVAEHVQYANRDVYTVGVGALIARATAAGNYPLLLASTLVMVLTVVLINRLVWRRLYQVAEDRFRME